MAFQPAKLNIMQHSLNGTHESLVSQTS